MSAVLGLGLRSEIICSSLCGKCCPFRCSCGRNIHSRSEITILIIVVCQDTQQVDCWTHTLSLRRETRRLPEKQLPTALARRARRRVCCTSKHGRYCSSSACRQTQVCDCFLHCAAASLCSRPVVLVAFAAVLHDVDHA